MKVRDAMHKNVVWVTPDTQLPDIAATMRGEDIGAVPVGENDRLIGMVTDRDLALNAFSESRDPLQLTARDVMSGPIVYCNEESELDDAIRIMENKQIRRLPVINAKRRMVGMLSLGDIAAAASPTLCSETVRAVSAHHA